MNNLIKAAEVWVPDAQGHLLEFGGGLYQRAAEFGMISRSMCFGRGEGLPGRVWAEGHPILLKDLQSGYFQRAKSASKAGLVTAVALPVYMNDTLKAVVVFFCGELQDGAGAMELWKNDPRITSDMTLVDGYYGASAAALEADSHETYLPRGSGLPGMAWQRDSAVFIDGVANPSTFVRAESAAAAGIQRGLALPCPVPGNDHYVLSLLSSASLPIASRLEGWAHGDPGQAPTRSYGYSEADGVLSDAVLATASGAAQDGIAAAFLSGTPQVSQQAGLLVLPIITDGIVGEVVALYF